MTPLPLSSLERMHEEVKAVLARQLETQSDLDVKAAESIKFNTLVFGILVSAVSLGPQRLGELAGATWMAWPFFAGFLLLGVSIVVAILAYRATELGAGLKAEDIGRAVDATAPEIDLLRDVILTYAMIIEGNRGHIDQNARLVNASMYTLLGGLLCLGTSTAGFMLVAT